MVIISVDIINSSEFILYFVTRKIHISLYLTNAKTFFPYNVNPTYKITFVTKIKYWTIIFCCKSYPNLSNIHTTS